MQKFSIPQAFFSVLTIGASIVFYYLLDHYIHRKEFSSIMELSVVYSMALLLSGLLCGLFERAHLVRYDIGFRYHVLTFIGANSVVLFLVFFVNGSNFTISYFLIQLLCWGFGLFIHYLSIRKNIKDYSASEIF